MKQRTHGYRRRSQGLGTSYFHPEPLDPIFKTGLPPGVSTEQGTFMSPFGFDLGEIDVDEAKSANGRATGLPTHIRWALTFVLHYLILHHGNHTGFVATVKKKSHYSPNRLRAIYPAGHFNKFDATPLLKVLHLPLNQKQVRMALNKTIKANFLTEYHNTICELDACVTATVRWVVKKALDYLLLGKGPREVKRPGKWMTKMQAEEETRKRLEAQIEDPDRLFYAPTCKKGGRHV